MESLMPSEVARLVLGYLKSSGCHASWETFLKESPDLKEYADCIRRGREYPTNIGGRNLFQFLDAGHQVLQCQGTDNANSSVELVSNLERVVNQLKGVLSQIQPSQTESQGRSGDTSSYNLSQSHTTPNGSTAPTNYSRQDRPADGAPRTTATQPTSSAQQPLRARSFHPNGDTTTYHLQAIVPPLHFLPTSTPLDKYTRKTPLKDDNPLDPPEKDLNGPLVRSSTLDHTSPMKTQLSEIFPFGRLSDMTCGRPYGESSYYTFMNPLSCGTTLRRYVSNDEPVRDTGMDLSRKPTSHCTTDLSEMRQTTQAHDADCIPQTCNLLGAGEVNCSETEEGKKDGTAENDVSPVNQGLEVETGTTVSEEIDVDGTSRDASPVTAAMNDAAGTPPTLAQAAAAASEASALVLPIDEPADSRRSSQPAEEPPNHETEQNSAADHDSMVAPTPASFVGDTDVETPAGTEPPPLPTRVPSETSPRCFLSNERSLLPSLTTPIKETRFSPNRFYSPRRKSLIPRRRLLSGTSPAAKQGEDSSSASAFEEHREVGTVLEELLSNFPFLEKLADNINRVVSTEPAAHGESRGLGDIPEEQVSLEKQASNSSNSQDLNLNLPESVVKDIMSRTESDPAFEELVAQMCEKIDTTVDTDVVLVTPKSKHLCRTPSSSQKREGPFRSPLTTPRRPSTADTPSCSRSSPFVSPVSVSPSSGIFQRTRSRLSPHSLDFRSPKTPRSPRTPKKGKSNPPSVSVLDSSTSVCTRSNASSPVQRQPETASRSQLSEGPNSNNSVNSCAVSNTLPDNPLLDVTTRPSQDSSQTSESRLSYIPTPPSSSAPNASADARLSSFSNGAQNSPHGVPARLDELASGASCAASALAIIQQAQPPSPCTIPGKRCQSEPVINPSSTSLPPCDRTSSSPSSKTAPNAQHCGTAAKHSSHIASSPVRSPSTECPRKQQSEDMVPPQHHQSSDQTPPLSASLPTNVSSQSSHLSTAPAVTQAVEAATPPQQMPLERTSFQKSPVKLISRTVEGDNTVTCISIPDQVPEKLASSHCESLSDLVNMVLTPNSKAQLESAAEEPDTPLVNGTVAQQSAVFVAENGTQVLYCASDTVTTQLQTGGAGPPMLVYPSGTVVLGMNVGTSPAKVAMPQVAVMTETPLVHTGLLPVQAKRLPTLQPKGPLPAKARYIQPPPIAIGPKKPMTSATQANRLKKSKLPTPQHQQRSLSSSSTALVSHNTDVSRTSTSKNPQQKTRSPQLKKLMQTVSSRQKKIGAHVRALDFGSDTGATEGQNEEGHAESEVDVSKTIESIGTSLTGVMQQVMRTSTKESPMQKKSAAGGPKKRKATPLESEVSQKKRCSEDNLKEMDVGKFLDAIHNIIQHRTASSTGSAEPKL